MWKYSVFIESWKFLRWQIQFYFFWKLLSISTVRTKIAIWSYIKYFPTYSRKKRKMLSKWSRRTQSENSSLCLPGYTKFTREWKIFFPYKCFSTIPFPENLARVNYPCDSSVTGILGKRCVCAILSQLHATVAINGDKSTIYRALLEKMEEICNFTVKTRWLVIYLIRRALR